MVDIYIIYAHIKISNLELHVYLVHSLNCINRCIVLLNIYTQNILLFSKFLKFIIQEIS